MKSFFGIKKDQSHTYNKDGKRLFITRIKVQPADVLMVKSQEKDGYDSVQIAIGTKKRINKALAGHCKNINYVPLFLREIKTDKDNKVNVGDKVKIFDVLEIGDIVKVTGISKGKGFAGAMKRHNFKGGPKTHGQSDRPRSVGSIGQGTSPGRIWKGKRMAGRMGNETITTMGSQVVFIGNDELWVTGAVPGAKEGLVEIAKINRKKKFVGLLNEPVKADEKPEEVKLEEKTNETEIIVETKENVEQVEQIAQKQD